LLAGRMGGGGGAVMGDLLVVRRKNQAALNDGLHSWLYFSANLQSARAVMLRFRWEDWRCASR
jgi:hypothetical protein